MEKLVAEDRRREDGASRSALLRSWLRRRLVVGAHGRRILDAQRAVTPEPSLALHLAARFLGKAAKVPSLELLCCPARSPVGYTTLLSIWSTNSQRGLSGPEKEQRRTTTRKKPSVLFRDWFARKEMLSMIRAAFEDDKATSAASSAASSKSEAKSAPPGLAKRCCQLCSVLRSRSSGSGGRP